MRQSFLNDETPIIGSDTGYLKYDNFKFSDNKEVKVTSDLITDGSFTQAQLVVQEPRKQVVISQDRSTAMNFDEMKKTFIDNPQADARQLKNMILAQMLTQKKRK